MGVGSFFGQIMYFLSPHRRNVAEVNLKLCFPDDDDQQIKSKLKKHFKALGMAVTELSMCWWWSDKRLAKLCDLKGLEHLSKAQAEGKGVILLSSHFTTLEIGGRLLALQQKVNPVYRKHKTPFVEEFVKNKRAKYTDSTIDKYNTRGMLKCLKKNGILWYAPDQNFSKKGAVLADFFGNPAPSNPATARLAKMTGAVVVPFVQYRRQDRKGYKLRIMPPLTNFPSGDELKDANRINHIFEQFIRKQPSHYYWVHRRFKRVPGRTDVYENQKTADNSDDNKKPNS